MPDEGDIKYGSLFKRSGFFKDDSARSNWSKRFFAFNKWNMMLQLWEVEEERVFKVHGCVRGIPKRSISLLSSQLVIERGPVQRSIFGQKYPLAISNGPAFEGRALYLSASSAATREAWIEAITGALEQLKDRQRVALMQKKIVTDPSDPGFNSLDNQHKIMMDVEAKVKELDQKINRTHFQCKLMRDKNNMLYGKQDKLWAAHRQVEDKLFGLTCEDTHPQRRFKFIIPNGLQEVKDLPLGIYKHSAQPFLSTPYHRPQSVFPTPISIGGCERVQKNLTKFKQRKRPDFHLEDAEYYPTYTENVIVDNAEKSIHEPTSVDYQIRQLDDSEDIDLLSFTGLNVFDLLKKENTRYIYRQVRDFQAAQEDNNCSDDSTDDEYVDDMQTLKFQSQVNAQSRRPENVMGEYKGGKGMTYDEAQGEIAAYEDRAELYLVEGKTNRF